MFSYLPDLSVLRDWIVGVRYPVSTVKYATVFILVYLHTGKLILHHRLQEPASKVLSYRPERRR